MCGIFAYINHRVPKTSEEILRTLVNGLRRLEYRGYDSAGVCVQEGKRLAIIKSPGNVQALDDAITKNEQGLDLKYVNDSHSGMAHTRWATHGEVSERNSHPHPSDPSNEFVVVHNGIMTNFADVKTLLEGKGEVFVSETDTEVIAKLTRFIYHQQREANNNITFVELVMLVMEMTQGAYAIVFKSSHFPGQLVACKRGSPLVMGVRRHSNVDAEMYGDEDMGTMSPRGPIEVLFASDTSPIIEHTKHVVYMEDDDIAFFRDGKVHIVNRLRNKARGEVRAVMKLEMELESMAKGNFPHFMLKEIYEQPESLLNSLRGRVDFKNEKVTLGGFKNNIEFLHRARRLYFISCGTSLNACVAVRALFEELSDIPVIVDNASDFLDRSPPIFRDDACIFVSQSGETADTLRALEYCKPRGALLVGVTNGVGSSIARATHCGSHINAGPEIGVASTKAYTNQQSTLLLLALLLSEDSIAKRARRQAIIRGLAELPTKIREALRLNDEVKNIAEMLKDSKSILVMGRGYHYATCIEAALKIKELSYIHSEGINSGELKHGPLALIDENIPVIIVCTHDHLVERSRAAIQQVRARKGRPIVITSRPDAEIEAAAEIVVRVPETVDCLAGILNIIPLQLLSYHLACIRGANVDCPRNLAKSVTVQ